MGTGIVAQTRRLAFAVAVGLGFAAPAIRADNDLFRRIELEALLGAVVPAGDLRSRLDPGPSAGARMITSYWGSWRAYGSLLWAQVGASGEFQRIDLLQFGAGFARESRSLALPGPRLGLVASEVRGERVSGEGERLQLESGEMEFGLDAGLLWHFVRGARFQARAGLDWCIVLSEPRWTHLPGLHLGAGWALR